MFRISLPFSYLNSFSLLRRQTPVKPSFHLDDSIQWTPGTPAIRREIALGIWDFDITQVPLPYTSLSLDAYFRYYTQQADLFVHDTGHHVIVRTHQHVIDISAILREDLDRAEAQERIRLRNFPIKGTDEAKAIDASLDLAIRLALMIEIGDIPNGFSGNAPLVWKHGKLSRFLEGYFAPQITLAQERVRLGKVFTARNIQRIAGIRIRWTDNLVDHLRLFDTEDDDLGVMIFPHASYLIMLLNNNQTTTTTTTSSNSNSINTLFPDGLISETLRTLALLFPRSDKAGRRWYQHLARTQTLDSNASQCPQLRARGRHVDEFRYWAPRLALLKQAFDDAEPNSWTQWWHDRRRGVHRYPLLLAAVALLLTVLLGVAQVVVGALQVYLAFHPRA